MLATSYLHPPKPVSLYTILESNPSQPSIDLEWEPFQSHVEAFLNAIDHYALEAKGAIADYTTDYNKSLRNFNADKSELERRIQMEKNREGEMLSTLENERLTVSDLQSSLSQLQTSLAKVREDSAALEAELNSIKKEVKTQRNEKERQGQRLGEMRGRDEVELRSLEEIVGWRVDGVKQDCLLMRFTLIDPSDPDREFSIVIDVSNPEYSVPNCSPPIPNLSELVTQLNADREFFTFIKKVRKAFRALVPEPPKPPSKFDDLTGPGLRTPAGKGVLISPEAAAAAAAGTSEPTDAMQGLKL